MPPVVIDNPVTNSPFREPTWHFQRDRKGWQYSGPDASNANFAWVQHFIHRLAPNWLVGFVLANGHESRN